jgi:uncharacterized protein (DUF934 family)
MPEIIRLAPGRVERDDWSFLDLPGAAGGTPASGDDPQLAAERIAVPLASWKAGRERLLRNLGAVGVWLGAGDDPAELAPDLDSLGLVAIHFPKFADGRGYSTAALLRTRYGYRGELRAIGDVGRDQLFYLSRCGFDSFTLAAHRDPHAALASLTDFGVRYQASVDDPVPLFRKRLAAGGARG